jgi:hypothetical protein
MPGLPGGLAGTGVSEQRTLSIGLVGADGSKSSVTVSLPGIELAGGAQLSELESAIGAFSNAGVFRATLGTDYKISVPTAQVETDFYDMGRALQIVLQNSTFDTIAVAIPAPKLSLFPDRRVLAQRDGTASIGTPARVIDDMFSALEDAINGSTDPAGGYAVVRTALTTRKSNRWVAPSVPELTES